MRQFHIFTLIVFLLAGGTTSRAGAVIKSAPIKEKQFALRTAIKDLVTTFGDSYPDGRKYLTKLDDIERRMNEASRGEIKNIEAEFAVLQRKALIANPHHLGAMNNLGAYYKKTGQKELAIKTWQKVLSIDPSYKQVQNNLFKMGIQPADE